jgi:3-methyl-2-oxobutanoate hydroxymethyltransferase
MPEPTVQPAEDKITLRELRRWARQGTKFGMLTCYDATTAKWLWRGGVRTLLVGDSAANVILGHDSTIHVSLDFLITLTAAVRRGAPDAFVMGDMPFGSYHESDAQAVQNAARMMTEGRADAVKMEVDGQFTGAIEKVARAGIPVVAHIGWRPQRMMHTGVPVVSGRTPEKIEELVSLARMMVSCGAAMLLVESATAEAGRAIVEAVDVPVIGCGAGPACHGHVVVLQDWLGMSDWQPSFAPPTVSGGPWLADAAARWVELVERGDYPADGGPYRMNKS